MIYNNCNATEAGMIATATPQTLRAGPETAGKPSGGTEIRILDDNLNELPRGDVGHILVRSGTLFEAYTSGATKRFHRASWHRGTWDISTTRAGCSWWAAMTR